MRKVLKNPPPKLTALLHVFNNIRAVKHYHRYAVEFEGKIVVDSSTDPEHDLARVLQGRGISGVVTMLDGITKRPRTIVLIDKAAKVSAYDGTNRLHVRKYKPRPERALINLSPRRPQPMPQRA